MRRFFCVRVRVANSTAERVVAEAWSAGASGLEERGDETGRTLLLLYAPAGREAAVCAAARRAAGSDAEIGQPEPVPQQDWLRAWRQGLAPVVVSRRLVVRPPFAPHALTPGQREVRIQPGQAFGTGGHASTRLALELLDQALSKPPRASRVLDVGTGSGVLALAALRLGAAAAVAFDLDPIAVSEAQRNADLNRLKERLQLFAGSLAVLRPVTFDLVLANLLRSELLPLLPQLSGRLAAQGRAILSGLLVAERSEAQAAVVAAGLRVRDERRGQDERGDRWLALLTSR